MLTITDKDFREKYGYEKAEPDPVPVSDYAYLYTLVKYYRPKRILEIGTSHGGGTLMLAHAAPEAQVFTIDVPKEFYLDTVRGQVRENIVSFTELGREIKEHPELASRITCIHADSKNFDFTSLGEIDFVFIDGCHDFTHVINDTVKSYKILKRGGILFWHDIDLQGSGVREALSSLQHVFDIVTVEGHNATWSVVW